jgi:hypothetical protein
VWTADSHQRSDELFGNEWVSISVMPKFVYKGMGPVTKEEQSVLWPRK